MGNKRKKSKSSNPESSFRSKRFVNEGAAERYQKFVTNKRSWIQERGLRPTPDLDGGTPMTKYIEDNGWELFTAQPEPGIVELVREFYANAYFQRDNDKVMVRGKMVDFSSEVIDEFYKINPPDQCAFYGYVERIDHTEILAKLCVPGTKWQMGTDKCTPVNFPENTLNRFAKAWYKFICAKLWPTSHQHEITVLRGALLLCICSDQKVNVGQIIHDAIVRSISGKTTMGHSNPCLVTELCKQVGVQIKDGTVIPPGRLIDRKKMKDYNMWDGGYERTSGLGFEVYDEDVPLPPPPRPLAGRSHKTGGFHNAIDYRFKDEEYARIDQIRNAHFPPRPPQQGEAGPSQQVSFRSQISDMYHLMAQQHSMIKRMNKQLDEMQQRSVEQAVYQARFNNAIVARFDQLRFDLDHNVADLPLFPEFPEHLLQPYEQPQPPQANNDGESEE